MFKLACAALASAVTLLSGCASPPAPPVDTTYVRSAGVSIATIQRDSVYSIIRKATSDTLILEDKRNRGHTITWLVQIPSDARIGQAVRFDEDSTDAEAWVIESLDGLNTHAVRAEGSVVVHSRLNSGVDATVVLRALTRQPGPGDNTPNTLSVTRKSLWEYRTPGTPLTPELDDNAG